MVTIKSFTDVEQSRKLAEFLPLESADMFYVYDRHLDKLYGDTPYVIGYKVLNKHVDIPCWSLSALLEILPKKYYPVKGHETNFILGKPKEKWCALYWDATGMQDGEQTLADNPVDACYEMIIHLHEQNLL